MSLSSFSAPTGSGGCSSGGCSRSTDRSSGGKISPVLIGGLILVCLAIAGVVIVSRLKPTKKESYITTNTTEVSGILTGGPDMAQYVGYPPERSVLYGYLGTPEAPVGLTTRSYPEMGLANANAGGCPTGNCRAPIHPPLTISAKAQCRGGLYLHQGSSPLSQYCRDLYLNHPEELQNWTCGKFYNNLPVDRKWTSYTPLSNNEWSNEQCTGCSSCPGVTR